MLNYSKKSHILEFGCNVEERDQSLSRIVGKDEEEIHRFRSQKGDLRGSEWAQAALQAAERRTGCGLCRARRRRISRNWYQVTNVATGIKSTNPPCSQLEFKSAALWKKKSADDLLAKRNDEAERNLAIEQYHLAVQNLLKGKCEQLASALLFSAIGELLLIKEWKNLKLFSEKLLDGTTQPHVNQYLHDFGYEIVSKNFFCIIVGSLLCGIWSADPHLSKSVAVQLVPFINSAAKLRNDESSARILARAACYLSDYPDTAKSFINRAMNISISNDARIIGILLAIKVRG